MPCANQVSTLAGLAMLSASSPLPEGASSVRATLTAITEHSNTHIELSALSCSAPCKRTSGRVKSLYLELSPLQSLGNALIALSPKQGVLSHSIFTQTHCKR